MCFIVFCLTAISSVYHKAVCTSSTQALQWRVRYIQILKQLIFESETLLRHDISKALHLFKIGSVFDALHQRVRYIQMKVSIIQALFKLQ